MSGDTLGWGEQLDRWVEDEQRRLEDGALPADHDAYYCDRCGGWHAALSSECAR